MGPGLNYFKASVWVDGQVDREHFEFFRDFDLAATSKAYARALLWARANGTTVSVWSMTRVPGPWDTCGRISDEYVPGANVPADGGLNRIRVPRRR